MKGAYKNITSFSKLGMVAFVALLSLVVSMIVAAVVAIPIFGQEGFSSLINSSISFDKENLPFLKYFQIAQSIGLFIVPSIILAILFDGRICEYLKLNKNPFILSSVFAVLIVFAAGPIINVIGAWNMQMTLPDCLSGVERWMKQKEDSAKIITELFVHVDTVRGLFFNIFMIGLIPAVGEEFLFRGVIQRVFTDWTKNKHVAIWVTAILFSALHLQFYGFLPRVILGAMFGYLLVYSGNLWLPIIAHFINNTAAVIAYYLYNDGVTNIDPDAIGTNSAYGLAAIASLFVVGFLFWRFYVFEKRKLEV